MKRAVGAGSAALLAAVAVTGADAASLKCARPQEVTALQAASIQQELMVAALTCHDTADFNSFQTSFNRELRASDATLLRMFHRLYGFRNGEAEYHAFKTRLANDSSMRSIQNNPDYCQRASLTFSAALAPPKPTLAQFVSGVAVSDSSPVDSCQIKVGRGIKAASAAAPSVVPAPKPVQVAQTQDPDDSAPPDQTPVDQAPVDQTPVDQPDASQPADASAPPAEMAPMQDQAQDQSTAEPDAAPQAGVLPPEGAPSDPNSAQSASTQPAESKQDSDWLSGLTDWF